MKFAKPNHPIFNGQFDKRITVWNFMHKRITIQYKIITIQLKYLSKNFPYSYLLYFHIWRIIFLIPIIWTHTLQHHTINSNRHLHHIDQPPSHQQWNKNVPSSHRQLHHCHSLKKLRIIVTQPLNSNYHVNRHHSSSSTRTKATLVWRVLISAGRQNFERLMVLIIILVELWLFSIELWFSCAWNFKQWSVCQIAHFQLLFYIQSIATNFKSWKLTFFPETLFL